MNSANPDSRNPQWSPDSYIRAFHFAARAHHHQCIPGTDFPYIMHISIVSMEVMAGMEGPYNGDLAVNCALLHDVIGDTSVTFDDLQREFGDAGDSDYQPVSAAGIME